MVAAKLACEAPRISRSREEARTFASIRSRADLGSRARRLLEALVFAGTKRLMDAAGIEATVHGTIKSVVAIGRSQAIRRGPAKTGFLVASLGRARVFVLIRTANTQVLVSGRCRYDRFVSAVGSILTAVDRIAARYPEAGAIRTGDRSVFTATWW